MMHPRIQTLLRHGIVQSMLWVMMLCMPAFVSAQPYLIRRYAIEEGLAQSQVSAIFQDSKGFLWFGTFGGISRFDGLQFETFTIDDGLSDNRILDLEEDAKGRLWIATRSGLNMFDGETFSVITENDGLLDPAVNDVMRTSKGGLWIGSQSGLSHYDGTSFYHITVEDGLPSSNVTSIARDRQEQIWIGTPAGLCVMANDTPKCFSIAQGLPAAAVSQVMVDSRDRVWAATSAGVARLDLNRDSVFTAVEALSVRTATTVLEDAGGAIWIGMRNGVVRLDSIDTVIDRWQDNGLILASLFEDREGNVWGGTSGKGAVQFQKTSFTHLNPVLNLPEDIYLAVYADPAGVTWIGTLKNGLFRIEDRQVRQYTAGDHPALNHIRHISPDGAGGLWIGGAGGIAHFDGERFASVGALKGRTLPYLFAALQDRRGTLWLATGNGLFYVKDDELRAVDLNMGASVVSAYSLYEDADRIWVATSAGLFYQADERVRRVEAVGHRPVSTILPDSTGHFWLGTHGYGVYRLNPAQEIVVDTLNTDDGLNSSTVYFTVFDNSGDLWVGTNTGINRLDMEAYGQGGYKQVRAFAKYDGLVGLETNTNAVTLDGEGKLLFGTIEALMQYDASARPKNEEPPPIYLSGMRLFLDAVPWASSKASTPSFPHDRNHFTFDFLGLSFVAPENLRYEYRLHGFDAEWSPPSESRYVTYSNLSPGLYTFEVKARNGDGVPSRHSAMYSFEVLPPFWRTSWFIAFCILTGSLAILGIVQWRTSALNRRRIMLEEMVTERTRDLEETHTELIEAREAALSAAKSKSAFLSTMTHEMRTPMNGIIGMTELLSMTGLDDEQAEYADTIRGCGASMMNMIENVLAFADLAAGQRVIAVERFDLPELLAESLDAVRPLIADKRLELRCHIAAGTPYNLEGDREHMRQILHHLLSNAAKFTTSGVVLLEAGVRQDDDRRPVFAFAVHDTGIGMNPRQLHRIFEAFSQADMSSTRPFQGIGIGLALAQQLSGLLGGALEAESEPGMGSTFRLSLSMEATDAPQRNVASASPLPGATVLIVLRDAWERRRLALLCRSLGMRVVDSSDIRALADVVITNASRIHEALKSVGARIIAIDEEALGADAWLRSGATGAEVERAMRSVLQEPVIGRPVS